MGAGPARAPAPNFLLSQHFYPTLRPEDAKAFLGRRRVFKGKQEVQEIQITDFQ